MNAWYADACAAVAGELDAWVRHRDTPQTWMLHRACQCFFGQYAFITGLNPGVCVNEAWAVLFGSIAPFVTTMLGVNPQQQCMQAIQTTVHPLADHMDQLTADQTRLMLLSIQADVALRVVARQWGIADAAMDAVVTRRALSMELSPLDLQLRGLDGDARLPATLQHFSVVVGARSLRTVEIIENTMRQVGSERVMPLYRMASGAPALVPDAWEDIRTGADSRIACVLCRGHFVDDDFLLASDRDRLPFRFNIEDDATRGALMTLEFPETICFNDDDDDTTNERASEIL